jgi:quercetin dioxygenase-like cupin family protein
VSLRPYALKAGEGATYSFGPGWVVKAGERGRGRRLSFTEYTTRRGEEPGEHTHRTEDEIFYVLQGALTFTCGGETFPRGIPHNYAIRSDGDVRLIIVLSPADEDAVGGWGGLIGELEAEGE